MRTSDLNIYVETFNMLKQLDKYIVDFPREIKYSYGFELRRLGCALIKDICIANECILEQKRRIIYLEQAYGEYEAFKVMIRLVTNLKGLSFKHAATMDVFLAKIGAMIIKWKKTAVQRSKEYRDLYNQEENVDFTNIYQEVIQPIENSNKLTELKKHK